MVFIDSIALIVCVTITVGLPAYLLYDHYQDKKTTWRELAKVNGLKYTRSRWFGRGDFVSGNFRDYHLKLETAGERIGDEEGYTRLVLSVNNSQGRRFAAPNPSDNADSFDTKLNVIKQFSGLRGKIKSGKDPQLVVYEQDDIEIDVEYLQSIFELLGNIADVYLLALALEGAVIPYLQEMVQDRNSQLRGVVSQLLDDIFQKITVRLKETESCLLCQNCLTNYEVHKVGSLWSTESFKYYGCRICCESQNSFEVQSVVALLDAEAKESVFEQHRILRINWLAARRLFDFDTVRVIKATDEDVERFAVQVGNDTDKTRKSGYQQIKCNISSDCGLSENTLRILRRTFGVVEVKELLTDPQ